MDLKMGLAFLQCPHQGMANMVKVVSEPPDEKLSDNVGVASNPSRWRVPPGPNQLEEEGTRGEGEGPGRYPR
jgi:hypothetical protein